MDDVRFKELFTEVERWVMKAREHHYVSATLTDQTHAAMNAVVFDRQGAASQSPQYLERISQFAALSNARALYFGLTLENAAKARAILDGKIEVDAGVPKGLRKDHNVIDHVRQSGVTLSAEESEFLELVSFQLTSLSKYPIAKDLKAQNRFTGRKVGGLPQHQAMVYSLVCRVLSDPRLVSIFTHGHASEHYVA